MRRVAIVGGGAAGALVALHALRRLREPAEVVVLEPRDRVGAGIAYATPDPAHLLNVRAAGMSALPDDPDHFRAWAGCGPDDYIARARYADYLADLLEDSRSASAGTFTHLRARVTRITGEPGRRVVATDDGFEQTIDQVVVATGNEAPALPTSLRVDAAARPFVVTDPWSATASGPTTAGASVVVVGSGLTAVDVALSLLDRDDTASLVMVSRHGLLPAGHDQPWVPPSPEPVVTPGDLAAGLPLSAAVRRLRSDGSGWRQRVDGLRPITQQAWLALSEHQRDQFVRHLLRLWDVHRHRMPPQAHAKVTRWLAEGRLVVEGASVSRITATGTRGDRALVTAADGRSWEADRVVVATGPSPQATASPLLSCLVHSGAARPGPLGWGIDVEPASLSVIDAHGRVQPDLWAVGAPTRGVLFECTAVPDVRVQAARVAEAITAAL